MRVIVLILFLMMPRMAGAEWVLAVGEQVFPPDVAEAEACQQADQRARAQALRQVVGEQLWAQDWMQCREGEDQADCVHNMAVLIDSGGYVRAIQHYSSRTFDDVPGYRRCRVQFQADVAAVLRQPDPNFDVGVRLNQTILRAGEHLTLDLAPSAAMAVQVFLWLPYEHGDAQVRRLTHKPRLDGAVTLPGADVDWVVALPPGDRGNVTEYVLVLASRAPLTLRDHYGLEDFTRLVAELPPGDTRLVRRAYTVMRGPS